MQDQFDEYKLYPNGKMFFNGLSNSYDDGYDSKLQGVLTEEELSHVIKTLNETIQKFWPCQPCYLFGVICAPLTLIPCFPTNYCLAAADKAAHEFLEQVSLKARYYDRRITFRLVKVGCCCKSYVSLTFPSSNHVLAYSGNLATATTPLISKLGTDIENATNLVITTAPTSHRKYM